MADLRLPGLAHAAVLRSPYAHARIARLDLTAALHQSGVLAAIGGTELGPNPPRLPMLVPHRALRPRMPHPLAGDIVRYVGEPVAVVVAESAYQAEDALEHILADYDELPAVLDAEAALEPGAPLLHAEADDNLMAAVTQTVGDPDAAFVRADLVLRYDFRFGRLSGQPMETRGIVAGFERTPLGESLGAEPPRLGVR